MKVFSRFLNIVTFAMLFCTANQVVANVKEDVSLEPICCIDGRLEKFNRGMEMILANEVGNCMCPFYLKVGGKENPIDISKDVISYLLKLGYSPKSFSSKGSCDAKPWKCEYLLNFEISIQEFDDEGNLLITFSHEDSVKKFKNGSKYQLNELGVWNKDYGFKIIKTPGIEIISSVRYSFEDGYLLISGYRIVSEFNFEAEYKTMIISMANGFWGERSKK